MKYLHPNTHTHTHTHPQVMGTVWPLIRLVNNGVVLSDPRQLGGDVSASTLPMLSYEHTQQPLGVSREVPESAAVIEEAARDDWETPWKKRMMMSISVDCEVSVASELRLLSRIL
eukprot:GHVR01125897.1.p1 GENE.GHVR01125897.1~~GHVR01125897.1.p1  ORF type:complete len:115 (+),score=44.47 GHVR01125897.1:2-346(+)